ncbi:MAG: hypothetical protein KDC88_05615 [Ignavibacteriae bacterium]|nr:hypothetical protein [Ignavibacteriota bacterium]MCB9260289.1 hypothetical protein [Ignavibacteriales bacterium]
MKENELNICSNCGTNNPLYEKICSNCKHYVRAAVVNIDLWKTIWGLFENPKETLKNIIYAEHKNFIVFILALVSVKTFITAASVQSAFGLLIPHTKYFLYNLLILLAIYTVSILLYTKILSIIFNRITKTRFKDNLSIILYSFIPIVLSLIILAPVEYGIFGKHWFISNPSPLLIKPNLAYVLFVLEFLMLSWSVYLLYTAFKIQSKSIMLSFTFLILLCLIIISQIIFIPFILL